MNISQIVEIFNAYLKGGSAQALKEALSYYDKHLITLRYTFHKKAIDDKETRQHINKLLDSLNVAPEHRDYYLRAKNLYGLLLRLNRRRHIQIDYILQLIDDKTKISRLKLALTGTGAVASLVGLSFVPGVEFIRYAIEHFLISLVGVPILGLVFTALVATFFFYKNYSNKKQSFLNRWRDNAFLIAGTVINAIGYSIWIVTAAPMTPLVAGLFIIASILDVAKEIVSLIQDTIRYKQREKVIANGDLNRKRTDIRGDYAYFKHRNAILINMAAAILMVGVMVAWCLIPGGIIVAASAIATTIAIYLVKQLLIKKNEASIREKLQSELNELDYFSAEIDDSFKPTEHCELVVENSNKHLYKGLRFFDNACVDQNHLEQRVLESKEQPRL